MQSILQEMCNIPDFLLQNNTNITKIVLENSNLSYICDDLLKEFLTSKTLRMLSLRSNRLHELSIIWKTKGHNLDRLWLGGNPIECHCDMLWAAGWLENATGASGNRLVHDYKDVICASGPEAGTPVYMINGVKMGCFSDTTATWIIVLATVSNFIILTLIVIAILLHRYWI